jgi:hypothetical protein
MDTVMKSKLLIHLNPPFNKTIHQNKYIFMIIHGFVDIHKYYYKDNIYEINKDL